MYRPPNQNNFSKIINAKESNIFGDSRKNMYQNNKYIVCDDNTISSKLVSSNIKYYHKFCIMYDLKQLIKSQTSVICSTSTLIHHILAIFPSSVSQKGVIDIGISNHQLIFCTQKKGGIRKYLNLQSFKNYTVDSYKEAIKELEFSKKLLNTFAYCNFFQNMMTVTDKIASYRNNRIKQNTKKWFNSEVQKN